MELNMVGAYGPFLDKRCEANDPGALSYRRAEFTDVGAWRGQARAKAMECLAMPDSGGAPKVETVGRNVVEGAEAEILHWQLPYGPPTEAVFLKPQGAKGPLPGVMALHDHGGMKFYGRHKISEDGRPNHPMFKEYRDLYYGGVAWANELAKRGYAVLCHDTFPFGSRRVRIADVPAQMRSYEGKPVEDPPGPQEAVPVDDVWRYNFWAAQHESIWGKSLASAGSTWPAMFLSDDMRAMDVLCARPEVDATRIGCCGLSGGGCRSVYLAGLDARIQAGICVGMMSTWRDYALYKAHTHTWMVWTPLLARYLDYPEIMGLRLPKPTMVLYDEEDTLFTLPEMRRADAMLRAIYGKAGAADRYVGTFYPGPHKFDLRMQADAFAWFDRWLKG